MTTPAALYGVTTKRLNEQVRRNRDRFPADFLFQLAAEEYAALRSQFATSNTTLTGRGGRRYMPYAFTEHGAIQAANVLNSPLAVEMGIYFVRAFVQLSELLASNTELARRFDQHLSAAALASPLISMRSRSNTDELRKVPGVSDTAPLSLVMRRADWHA